MLNNKFLFSKMEIAQCNSDFIKTIEKNEMVDISQLGISNQIKTSSCD